MPLELDRSRVEKLAAKIGLALKVHYLDAVGGPDNVATFEALNALGMMAATIIAGTGNAPEAKQFFQTTVDQQVSATMDQFGMPQQRGSA
jgi:hypothetical protein